MSKTKDKKEWYVLKAHGVMLVAHRNDVKPKHRLSQALTYAEAHALKHLF
jgi:hypothetical protein